LTKVSCHCDR